MVPIQYSSIGWTNTHIIVTIQESTQVTSCCNLLAPIRHLSFISRSARLSFSQVQRVFIVEHYLASRSNFTFQNGFRDTFPDSPVPNKSKIPRRLTVSVTQELFTRLHQTWGKEWMHASLNAVDISNTYLTLFFVFRFQCNLFLTNWTYVRNGLRDFSITLLYFIQVCVAWNGLSNANTVCK
jgi:hypothetical protein